MDNLLKALGLILYIAFLPLLGLAEILIDLFVFVHFITRVSVRKVQTFKAKTNRSLRTLAKQWFVLRWYLHKQ